ncbi:hypothetical protein [Pedobacter alluvionis]|uniref:Uncharacterized protein n=1 Tax=Pedobacter alluvionis TaxID=475253 RepID=A0A497Y3W0_9SPHI|nr:hypothetical protein [Pedobacter alluvionis]RLJ76746.1 hypothetical protein BCL90_1789 [Pedobacter alluvionis]TFB33984.1 hypothetical protein E3V97_08045 [Pedobacter alluvionis]
MFSLSNPVLRKIFVDGFYRTHAGMLVFVFVILISYCLFINTLGTVMPDQIDFWQFFFTISLVSNPLIMVFYLVASSLYAYKSLKYVLTQLVLPQQEFLYYSFTSSSKKQQFLYWFMVLAYIFIPVWCYTLYAIIIGIVFGYYLISIGILLFQLLLIIAVACIILKENNRLVEANKPTWLIRISRQWNKPVFLLYSFQVFNRSKLAYLLTKLLSWVLISSVFMLFSDIKDNSKLLMLITSCIVVAHIVLIYQERTFNDRYLSFLPNFPFSKVRVFFSFCLNYLILLLPEICWMTTRFGLITSFELAAFAFSAILLFRSLLLLNGIQVKGFLIGVFGLFLLFYVCIMFGLGLVLIPINMIVAWGVFRRNYLNDNYIGV